MVANTTTNVRLCSEEYTLAEAIERKRLMAVEKDIISETKEKLADA